MRPVCVVFSPRMVPQIIASTAHRGAGVQDARFVPRPPGDELEQQTRDCVGWITSDHDGLIDPVVAAGMGHYQFETLHPYQ